MSRLGESGGGPVDWYRSRIGEPTTDDEALGYWLFVAGVVLGVVGIFLYVVSRPAGTVRQWSIVLATVGLVLVIAGPIVRLPLQRTATVLVYAGALICLVALGWFLVAFPGEWTPQQGNPEVIGLYALGLLVMAIGGVLVPILTDKADLEAEVSALAGEVVALQGALRDSAADEDDLVARLREFRQNLADTEVDEADLAARLRSLRTSQSRFELYEDAGGEWRWRLRHRNGNVVATSGEGYTRRHNAQKGLAAVRRDALGATMLLIEDEADLPAEEERFDPVEETESRATFERYEDAGGEHRWRLVHENGNVLADGGEGYASRSGADEAVERVKRIAGPADYLRPDPTAFEVYRDTGGEWRWRLVHENGNVLADGGEGYTRRRDARRAIDRIRDGVDDMEFHVYEDAAGEHRWRLLASNDRIVADSGEGYATSDGADDAVDRVREYAPDADVLDVGWGAFEVYEAADGEFRWRLRHRNGNILADSGEGYADRSGAYDGVESVKRNAANAEVTSVDEVTPTT